ncbi:hypothetical protein FRB94_014696 [Tulasnella sp. JGI-2019a]|nr:hypothetical protein FRB94_014696 [Tulasnella sp. JGI-2019a]
MLYRCRRLCTSWSAKYHTSWQQKRECIHAVSNLTVAMTAPERVEWPVYGDSRVPMKGNMGGDMSAYLSAGVLSHILEDAKTPTAPVDQLRTHLMDILHQLRTVDKQTGSDTEVAGRCATVDHIWQRWTALSHLRQCGRWRTADTTILRLFVRLAGNLQNTPLLSVISSFLGTSPGILPYHERVLHPEGANHNITGKRLVLQWAIARTKLDTKEWPDVVRSLQEASLAPSDTSSISRSGLAALAARVIAHWLSREYLLALDLYTSASQNGVNVPDNTRLELALAAIQHKHFNFAVGILSDCTEDVSQHAMFACASRLVRGLSDGAIVSMEERTAKCLGSVLNRGLRGSSDHRINPKDARHWQWCILLLVRSKSYTEAVRITRSLPASLLGNEGFLKEFSITICGAQRFADAWRLLRCIPHKHSSYIPLHQLVFTYSAKAGANRYAKLCWGVLTADHGFDPSDYEHLLWRQTQRDQRLGKRTSPLPITRKMQASDLRTLQLGNRLLVIDGRAKLGTEVVERKVASEANSDEIDTSSSQVGSARSKRTIGPTNVLNALLSSRLFPRNGSAVSHRKRVQDVFDAYAEFTGTMAGHDNDQPGFTRPHFEPDLVTLNIMIKAWMKLDEVTSQMICTLFDRLSSLGYPSSFLKNHPTFSLPFVHDSTQHWSFFQGLVDSASKSSKGISIRKHALPLCRTFIKELYRRGDIGSARAIVRIYKSMKREEDLRDEMCARKQHLHRIGKWKPVDSRVLP